MLSSYQLELIELAWSRHIFVKRSLRHCPCNSVNELVLYDIRQALSQVFFSIEKFPFFRIEGIFPFFRIEGIFHS